MLGVKLYYNTFMKANKLIEKAKAYCTNKGLRLTPPRLYVLEIFARAEKSMGAYDVLAKLGEYIDNPKPPTAYRAIDFWREHGFIHRVESLNAYVTCCQDHAHHNVHFLVCDDCNSVSEVHLQKTKTEVLPAGFVATKTFAETHGTCGTCTAKN